MIAAPSRPVLRYHGGKWILAPWIIAHFPAHRIYVEPYGGGASVLIRKLRSYSEVYNDLDGEVVNVFRVLQSVGRSRALRRRILLTPFARAEFEMSYEPTEDPVERAHRTLVRSFMGHGSNAIQAAHGRTGFRANAHRQGTTPAADWKHWPDQVPRFVERLRGVTIECRDALQVIAQQDSPHTLFYVDPPYVHSTRSQGNLADKKHFYAHEMDETQHADLAAALRKVVGYVVVSGYPSALYDQDLYAGWYRVERHAIADGALPRREVLWLSPRTVDAIPHQEAIAL